MKTAKIAVGLIIIAVGFVVAGFVFFSNKMGSVPDISGPAKINSEQANAPKIENLPVLKPPAFGTELKTEKNLENEPLNLTRRLAETLLRDVLEQNPNGPDLAANKDFSFKISNFDEKLLKKYAEELKLIPVVKNSQIKILTNYSKTDLEKYLKQLKTILIKLASAKFPANTAPADNQGAAFLAFEIAAKNYNSAIPELYALVVPKELADFHKKEIALITAHKNIFEKLTQKTMNEDPLIGIIALESFKKVNSELALLKKEINKFIAEHGLNFN